MASILERVKVATSYEDLGTEFDEQILESINNAIADLVDVGLLAITVDATTDDGELTYSDGVVLESNVLNDALGYIKQAVVLELEPASGVQMYAQANLVMNRKLSKVRKAVVTHAITNDSDRDRR